MLFIINTLRKMFFFRFEPLLCRFIVKIVLQRSLSQKKNHQIILIDVKVIISVCLLFRSMIHKLTCAPNNQFNILKINQYFPEKHYLPREYIFSVNKTRFSKICAHLKRTYGFTFLSRSNHILNKWLGVEHRLW